MSTNNRNNHLVREYIDSLERMLSATIHQLTKSKEELGRLRQITDEDQRKSQK